MTREQIATEFRRRIQRLESYAVGAPPSHAPTIARKRADIETWRRRRIADLTPAERVNA